MKVVGVGPAPGYLTEEVKELIKDSKTIRGSERALEIVEPFLPENCDVGVIEDYGELDSFPKDALVLSTGDPLLSGLGKFGDEVFSGISSLQLACSRLKVSQLNTVVVSLHGREKEFKGIIKQLSIGNKVFLIPDPSFDIVKLKEELKEEDFNLKVYLMSRLGYPDEDIKKGTLENPPDIESDLFSIFLIPEGKNA